MSFKRAEDDSGQSLHELRRRRVGDLLREDIAEDEVARLSNGRLTCMVCHHRPIFDTLDMFYVHRQGKKHTKNAAYQAVEKQELQDLIAKRQHEQFVKTGNTYIQQAQVPAPRGLGMGKPYDPRTKKHAMPYDRKPTLDIGDGSLDVVSPVESTSTAVLPGNRKDFIAFKKRTRVDLNDSDRNSYQSNTNQIKHAGESIKNQERHNDKNLGNAQSKSKLHVPVHLSSSDNSVLQSDKIGKFISQVNQNQNSSHFFIKRKKLKADTTMKLETELSRQNNAIPSASSSESKSAVDWEKFQKYRTKIMTISSKPIPDKHRKRKDTKPDPSIPDSTVQTGGASNKVSNNGMAIIPDTRASDMQINKKVQAERELQLRGAGWKRDWAGKWVQDQDAEFDSDEEMPDLP